MLRRRTVCVTAVVLVAAFALAACGGDGDKESAVKALATKPVVNVPDGPPPTKLTVKDLVVGKGAEAKTGQNVTVQYVGVAYSDKKQFDASWDGGQPFPFRLGGGDVIKGWDQGVPGMHVGGRRQLIVPPDLGYGPEGYPPVIKPNETLIFVVDLVSVS